MTSEQKRYATREEILAIEDIQIEDLHIPEWDMTLRVKNLSTAQVERAQARMKGKGIKNATAILVAMAVVDEDGKRMFQEGDLKNLSKKSFSALNRILKKIVAQNALDEEGLEELAKNSENGRGEDLLLD